MLEECRRSTHGIEQLALTTVKTGVAKILLCHVFLIALGMLVIFPGLARCGELVDRQLIAEHFVTLFREEKFQQLEVEAYQYLSTQARTSSGLWKLTLLYSGSETTFSKQQKDRKFWDAAERRASKWISTRPASAMAHLVYATMLLNRGWSIRGVGYSESVRPEDWAPFRMHLDKARTHLEKHKAIASGDPFWYELMLDIATWQQWAEADFARLLDEALDRHPYFYQIYFAAIDYYVPKWGGNPKSIESFARASLARTKSVEGFGMYARIYWYASQTEYDDTLFSDSLVDWNTMKLGIDDVLKRYPDQWNLNNFAWFACLARDRPKTAELIGRLKGPLMTEVWVDAASFQDCRDWALGTRQSMLRSMPGSS